MAYTIGSVRAGIDSLKMQYAIGDITGLPPDADLNGLPDHLGDTAFGEPTLLDAVLAAPLPPEQAGWKEFPGLPFPFGGRYYGYLYDAR